jgi:DNA-binding ferritin-like protein (Dps family)
MKLAEALMERKAIKTKMTELKKRIYQNATVAEDEEPAEDPLDLMEELFAETAKLEEIIIRINKTNNATPFSDDMTLMEAIIKKDMLDFRHSVYKKLADKATPVFDRYSMSEIKFLPAVDVKEVRKRAAEIAREYHQLNTKIQEINWKTELL